METVKIVDTSVQGVQSTKDSTVGQSIRSKLPDPRLWRFPTKKPPKQVKCVDSQSVTESKIPVCNIRAEEINPENESKTVWEKLESKLIKAEPKTVEKKAIGCATKVKDRTEDKLAEQSKVDDVKTGTTRVRKGSYVIESECSENTDQIMQTSSSSIESLDERRNPTIIVQQKGEKREKTKEWKDERKEAKTEKKFGSTERPGQYEKVSRELQEVKDAKKKLEEMYQVIVEADRLKANDMSRQNTQNKLELARITREAHQEVRKLMDELRSKDRVIVHLEKELGYKSLNRRSADSDITHAVDGDRYQMRITDLSRKLRRAEEECQQLCDEKTEMNKRLSELEKRLRPAQEKTRRYLHRTMDLTAANRTLEDTVKKQGDDNARMKTQLEEIRKRMENMSATLAHDKQEKAAMKEITRKFEQAQKEIADLQKGVNIYKKDCAEKDRRIELLKHFQKQAREAKVNNKEMEERRKLSAENRRINDQLRCVEGERQECADQLRAVQEQNESLEFRVLELEELVEKLEDGINGGSDITDEDREEVTISILDILDIDVGELMGRLDQMKRRLNQSDLDVIKEKEMEDKATDVPEWSKDDNNENNYMKPAEKTVILKAKAMLDIADKRLKAAQTTERELKERIGKLEAEKAELLSHATGVSPDCVLEYEENLEKLQQAQKTIEELESAKKQLEDSNKAQEYESGVEAERLQKARDEVADLKRQVQSLHEGRDSEEQVMNQLGRNKDMQQKLTDLERELAGARLENETLKEQLSLESGPDCKDLSVLMNMKKLKDRIATVEKENDLLKNSELGETVMELKGAREQISDLEWEKEKLQVEVDVQKKRNHELEDINSEITKNYSELSKSISTTRGDVDKMKEKLAKSDSEERSDLSKDNERLRSELFVAKQEITHVDKELNTLEDSFVKISDENDRMKRELTRMTDLMNELAKLRTGLNAKEYELKELQKSNEKTKEDLTKARKAYVIATAELDDFNEKVKDLENEKEGLAKELEESKEILNGESVPGKERKKLQREERVGGDDIMKEEVSGVSSALEAWPGELADSGLAEDGDESPQRMSPDQLYVEEKAQLHKQIDDLTQGKQELTNDIQALKENEERLRSELAELSGESKEKDNKLADMNENLEQLQKDIEQLRSEDEELKKDLETKADQLAKLESELEQEKTDKEKLTAEKNDLNEKLNSLEDSAKDQSALDDKCQSLELKNMDLMQLVSDSEEKETDMKNEIQNLKNEIEKLKNIENELRNEMEDVKYDSYDKIGNLKEENEKLKKNEEKLSESLQDAEETERELRDRLDMLENPSSDLNRELQELRKENDELNDKLDEMERRIQNADELTARFEEKSQSDMKDLENEKELLEEEVMNLKNEISRLENEVDRLDDELTNSKDEQEVLNDALSKAQKRVKDLEQCNNDSEEVIDDLHTQLDDKDRKLSELKEDIADKDEVIEKQTAEIQEKETIIEKQNAEIMEKDNTLHDLDVMDRSRSPSDERKIKDLEDKLDVLTASEDKLLDQVKDLEAQIHGSKHSSPGDSFQNPPDEQLLRKIDELEENEVKLLEKIDKLERSEQKLMEELALADLESAASDLDTSADAIKPSRNRQTYAAPSSKSNEDGAIINETASSLHSAIPDASTYRIGQENVLSTHQANLETDPENSQTAEKSLTPEKRNAHEYSNEAEEVVVDVRVSGDDVIEGLRHGARQFSLSGDLDDLSHDELISRCHKLQKERIKDKKRIKQLENAARKKDKNGQPLLGDEMGKNQSTVQDGAVTSQDDVITSDSYHADQSMDPSNVLSDEDLQELDEEQDEEVERLKESERALKEELAAAKQAQDDAELLARIDKLKKSERELDAKLNTYDSHDVESLSRRLSDVSDDDLRRKVVELERMEKQLNNQIVEMEQQQEVLEEISREDKNEIHDLTIQLKEQSTLTDNMKAQVQTLEQNEADLQEQLDQAQTDVEELEDQLNRVKRSEKRFKDEVRLLKDKEIEANKKSLDLDDQITDLTSRENKLLNQIKNLEAENQSLQERVEKLQERTYDLESNEIIDKQQIRDLEKRIRKLQSDIAAVVTKGAEDMSSLNDNLQRKCTNLEQDRAGLSYEVTDLSGEVDKLRKELSLAQSNETTLKNQLEFYENTQRKFQKKTKDLELIKLDLMDQIDDLEKDKLRPVSPMPNARLGGKDAEIERLHDELAASQQKVKELLRTVKNLKQQTSDDGTMVTIPHSELIHLEHQNEKLRLAEQKLHMAEKTNHSLMDSLKKIRAGKGGEGSDLEIRDLQNQIQHLNGLLKEKQAARHAGELIVDNDNDMKDGDIITIRKPGKREEKGVQSDDSELSPVQNGTTTPPRGGSRGKSRDTHPDEEELFRPEAAKHDHSAPRDFSDLALDDLTAALDPLNGNSSRRSSVHLPDSDQEAEEEQFSPTHQAREETLPDFDRLDHPEKYRPRTPSPKPRDPSPRPQSRDPSPRQQSRGVSPSRPEDSVDSLEPDHTRGSKSKSRDASPSLDPHRAQGSRDPSQTSRDPAQTSRDRAQTPRDPSPRDQRDSRDRSPGKKTEGETPMSSPEKRRRNKNKDYDGGDSDSSMDEAPIAGMNRRESQLFDVPPGENLPETGGKSRLVKQEPTAESEDLTVSIQLSDESQPNSPERGRRDRSRPRQGDIAEEEIAPSRGNRNFHAPERAEMDDHVPEARVNVPNMRRRRPSDGSAADSGFHSNVHSQNTDDYDRSSTPSRSTGPYDPAHGTPHLSPWLTHQLVDSKSTGTATDNFRHRAEKKEWPVGPLRHIGTDTEEMMREDSDEVKRLKQIIADLQCELKVKQRELETARFVQKGLEEKVKNAEDSFTWKAKVKERDRDLSNKDRLLRNVMDENMSLMDEIQDKQRQISLLQAEVDNLDTVCKAKDAEGTPETIAKLKEELDRSQTSLGDVIGDREELDVDNKALKHQIEIKNKDILDKTEKIDELSRELKRANNSMKDAEQVKMEAEGKLRSAELELEKLRGADERLHSMRDEYAGVKNKNVDMEDMLHQLERDKTERDELRNVVADLKEKLRDYENTKSDKADLEHRVNTMQKLLDNKPEDGVARPGEDSSPLRGKCARLGDKCREKDDLIKRLVGEMARAGAKDSPVVKEAERMKQVMPTEEYNRPMTPVEEAMMKPTSVAAAHSSAYDLPNGTGPYHDADIIPTRLEKSEHAPDQSRIPMPLEHLPPMQHSPALHHSPMHSAPAHQAPKPQPRPGSFHPYDPRQEGRSPRHGVSRTSSMNGSDLLHNVPLPSDGLTEILPTTVIRADNKAGTMDRAERQKSKSADRRKRGAPNPPSDFHIARILSDRNVMVAWQPPAVDELDRSNGVQVVGYKISVDDIEKHKVSSPHLSKALIGRLDLQRPHKLSIQTVGAKGELSGPVHTYFEDVMSDTRGSGSDLGSFVDDDVDASSMASMNAFKNNEPKTFMAVYDYDPATQSPNPFPNSELVFKTGDLVMTYGRVRQDGFYNAKVRGKKGLVPASFIEPVPVNKKQNKHSRHSSRPGSTTNLSINHHPTL